jgi:hypothetical protein
MWLAMLLSSTQGQAPVYASAYLVAAPRDRVVTRAPNPGGMLHDAARSMRWADVGA